jgi:hypothetical protein
MAEHLVNGVTAVPPFSFALLLDLPLLSFEVLVVGLATVP